MPDLFDKTKSIKILRRDIIISRLETILEIMREKNIYQSIVIPDLIFLRNKWYNLLVDYPFYAHNDSGLFLEESGNGGREFGHTLYLTQQPTDDEFIKIIRTIDELIDDDLDETLDSLYGEVNDQERIDKIRKELDF